MITTQRTPLAHVMGAGVLLVSLQTTTAEVIYDQPHNLSGTLYQSSWWEPDDSDYDQWQWDNFTLDTSQTITEITWRGGYIYNGMYSGTVHDFTVAIFPSIAAGTEPDIVNPPLVSYETGGDSEETSIGTFGGMAMYDYHFVLPSPFPATAGTKYWIQIEAWQLGLPEWGLASASGGNGSHFRWLRGAHMYQHVPGDAAFMLFGTGAATFTIAASASPSNGGAVQGAGAYPAGSTASLVANSNAGFGFVNWTEGGTQISTNATYNFTVVADRTLIANFTPAYTITTSSTPSYGGTTSGGGVFNSGTPVTVTATPNPGFAFINWTWFGTPMSSNPVYTFTPNMDMPLVANFGIDPLAVMFDFDTAPVFTSLPITLTINGLTADLSATGSGFSIQFADTMGFTPAGFAGRCIYPNSVFPADLLVAFSETLTDFSILYSPQELGCDDSATMRVTAYLNGIFVGTATVTASNPGTWPSETLRINVPAGFNSVVVHYDARPPTCQDWGPIFLADNMMATRGSFDCSGVNNCSGHGVCITPNGCLCDIGWLGTMCDSADCTAMNNCSGHGHCTAPDTCGCDPGWTGPDCAIPAAISCETQSQCVLAISDVCAFHQCTNGFCVSDPIMFGNVNGSMNPMPNLDDILCVLAGFGDFDTCPNGDIAPAVGPGACQGDGLINLDDILAVLAAFAGDNPCGCNP